MMKRDFPTFLLYAFGFLLLWEWLRPMEVLTDISHIWVFIVFLILSLALSFFKMKWIWQVIMKIIYILVSINQLHYQENVLQFNWLKIFILNAVHNAELLADRDWGQLSNEFRTLLLFILLWLMVYLLHYWLLKRQRIFLFFFITLIYITVLDTFTPYNAKGAVVRTVMVGFAVMGMLTYYRMIRSEKFVGNVHFLRKWMVPVVGMIALSVLAGVITPKAAPLWPDPVPYLKAVGQKSSANSQGSLGPKRVGYGSNDERLGGPFISDNNQVFMYQASGKTYWKVETKDEYTGKGWIPSGATSTSFMEGDLVPVYPISDTVEADKQYASVFFHINFNAESLIMYPAGIQQIQRVSPSGPDPYSFEMDTTKEKITAKGQGISNYVVEYKIPKYKISDLRKTIGFPSEMNPEFYKRYTSLPKGLPERIKQLTEKITSGETNWFDKAKAVEQYFNSPDYNYDQKNVAVPGKNDDYVDQFLFKTKHGYCDNFSTSMAVMLRTIGIPTRWVKGFTGGDIFKYNNSSRSLYEVTNNDAHSWVEVFLPNVGWVPFEPTKGYSNDTIINNDTKTTTTTTQQTAPVPVKKPQQLPKTDDNTGSVQTKVKTNAFKVIVDQFQSFLKVHWKRFVLILLLCAAVSGGLYRIRGKWYPYLLLARYRLKKNDETISTAYLLLLGQFERYGLKRKENQTLSSYAKYIDTFFETREMTRLTNCYEQYLYQRNLPEGIWKETRELWENLIKKTIA